MKIKKQSKKIILFGAVAVVLAAITGASIVAILQNQRNDVSKPASDTSEQKDTINLDPPTKEDVKRVDDNKQSIIDREQQQATPPPTSTGKKTVIPTITYAGQYGQAIEVGAYVTGIFEEGGSCTATFSKGSISFSKSVAAVRSANAVDCPVMSANASEFSQKGSWSVTVTYSSPTATGVSEAKTVEVT